VSMLIGAATPNAAGSDYSVSDTAFGPLTARRSYQTPTDFPSTHGVPSSFSACNAHIDWDAAAAKSKYVSIYSCKPDIAMLGAGSLDSAVTAFVNSIPSGHRAILAAWHEGDGKVRQGAFTKSQWQDAQAEFCAAVKAVGNPDVYTSVILEAYQPGSGTDFADMWRSDLDGLVDVFLVDGYTDLGSEGQIWGKSVAFADAKGLPWGIAETGVRSGTISTSWMAKQIRYAQQNDAAAFCWFNTTTGGVLATPGTGAGPIASAQAASILHQVDPATWVL
jgi:hypothetical protein